MIHHIYKTLLLSLVLLQSCISISVDEPIAKTATALRESASVEQPKFVATRRFNCNAKVKLDLEKKYQESIYSILELGKCYSSNQKFPMAMRYFKLAIDNSKDQETKRLSYIQMALVKMKMKNDQEAISLLKRSIKIKRTLTSSVQLSELYLKYGAYEKVLSTLRPHAGIVDSRVFKLNGIAELLLGKVDRSIRSFSQINQRDLRKPVIGLHYAWALIINKKYQKAKMTVDSVSGDISGNLAPLRHRVLGELENINLTGNDSNV